MQKVAIDKIIVGERFRKEYGDVEALASSLARFGLLHPIVVDDNLNLIAGGRRLEAAKSLGWREIPVTTFIELDEVKRRELELEENLIRKDMTWEEEVNLRREIHELKQRIYGAKVERQRTDLNPGGWGIKETAATLDINPAIVSQDIKLAKALEVIPELRTAKNKHQAMKMLDKITERLTIEKAVREGRTLDADEVKFVNQDALEFVSSLPVGSVHCVITDPPWGVDFDEEQYDDSKPLAMDKMDQLFSKLVDVVTPGGHIYVFFGTNHYSQILSMLQRYFLVDPIPLIWYKREGGMVDWEYRFAPEYETIFYCRNVPPGQKGRRLSEKSSSVLDFKAEIVDKIHKNQKPETLLRHLIRLSTVEGEVVLDPFSGSAATLAAAYQSKRRAFGSELSADIYHRALTRLNDIIANTTDEPELPIPAINPDEVEAI